MEIEISMILDKDLEYYENLMESMGAENVFSCDTHDIYLTNRPVNELLLKSENDIKNACVRLREVKGFDGTHFYGIEEETFAFQNYKIYSSKAEDSFKVTDFEAREIKKSMKESGWYELVDTFKRDYQYKIERLGGLLQFQEIDNIGLVLYYSNPDYAELPVEIQKKRLFDDLEGIGITFEGKDQKYMVDKLRSLIMGSLQFSER